MSPVPSSYQGRALCAFWAYRDAGGGLLGYVARYDDLSGDKDCVPYFKPNGSGFTRC